MSKMRRSVYSKLDPADYRQLRHEAAARSITVTACIADCLREYFAFRTEMATAITAPGEPEARHTGLIHSLFARAEERLAATLDSHTTDLIDELRRIESMLDRLILLYLLHTPEVARELQESAVASANRRYANYRQAVNDLLATCPGHKHHQPDLLDHLTRGEGASLAPAPEVTAIGTAT